MKEEELVESAMPVRKRIARLFELYYYLNEYVVMSIISRRGPGFFFRWVFRSPLYLYRLGMGGLIGGKVLLLTAKGRKSGLDRVAALGYEYDPEEDAYYLVAGWDGKTDWYQNARANPRVRVRIGRRAFEAVAEPVPEERAMKRLAENARRNPFSARMWPRWTGRPFDLSEAGLRAAVPHFPMLALRPITAA
jgi:deazaflavin-dependent oxidoreductase (nitroreductase family)